MPRGWSSPPPPSPTWTPPSPGWCEERRTWCVHGGSGSARTVAATRHDGLVIGVVSDGEPDPRRAAGVRDALARHLVSGAVDLRRRRRPEADHWLTAVLPRSSSARTAPGTSRAAPPSGAWSRPSPPGCRASRCSRPTSTCTARRWATSWPPSRSRRGRASRPSSCRSSSRPGYHVHVDIAAAVSGRRDVLVTGALGPDDRLVDLLVDRLVAGGRRAGRSGGAGAGRVERPSGDGRQCRDRRAGWPAGGVARSPSGTRRGRCPRWPTRSPPPARAPMGRPWRWRRTCWRRGPSNGVSRPPGATW